MCESAESGSLVELLGFSLSLVPSERESYSGVLPGLTPLAQSNSPTPLAFEQNFNVLVYQPTCLNISSFTDSHV